MSRLGSIAHVSSYRVVPSERLGLLGNNADAKCLAVSHGEESLGDED